MLDLAPYTFAFLDVETTGLATWFGDRICEIAILRTQGDEVVESFQTLVNPERSISPAAARVNGLKDDEVAEAPRFAEIAEQVETLLDGAILVCHNAPFDLGFVESEMDRTGRQFRPGKVIDTLQIARRDYNFFSNRLGAIAAVLGIKTPNAHRAMGDVLTTRQIFHHFVNDLSGRGLHSLDELEEGYYSPKQADVEVVLPPEIKEALQSGARLTLTYVDRKGFESRRTVTPRQVLAVQDYIYLVAYCHLRQGERNFRLDRIVDLELA